MREAARKRTRGPRNEEREILSRQKKRVLKEEGSGPSHQGNLGRRRKRTRKARKVRPRVAGRGEMWWWEERREVHTVWRGEVGEEGERAPRTRPQE